MPRVHQPGDGERGVVLVVVLWVVASMALLVSAFNASVRGNASVLASERISAERGAALEAGLEIAVAQLLADDKAALWPRNGTRRPLRFGGHRMTIAVQDANGLIDLNASDEALLLGLLEQVGASPSDAAMIRDRILDWRDPDDRTRLRGAEDFNYERAGLDHGAGDSDFLDVTQLRDVLGVGPALYRRLAPYLTVYNADGRINSRTAPRQVLMAVPGISESDIDQARLGSRDETRATTFVESDRDRADGPGAPDGEGRSAADSTSNQELLTRDLGAVMIVRVELQDDAGGATLALEAAVMPAADPAAPYRVLSWRLNGASRDLDEG